MRLWARRVHFASPSSGNRRSEVHVWRGVEVVKMRSLSCVLGLAPIFVFVVGCSGGSGGEMPSDSVEQEVNWSTAALNVCTSLSAQASATIGTDEPTTTLSSSSGYQSNPYCRRFRADFVLTGASFVPDSPVPNLDDTSFTITTSVDLSSATQTQCSAFQQNVSIYWSDGGTNTNVNVATGTYNAVWFFGRCLRVLGSGEVAQSSVTPGSSGTYTSTPHTYRVVTDAYSGSTYFPVSATLAF